MSCAGARHATSAARERTIVTYRLPPLNGLRAFEAAARHMSFKYAADELCVTAGAVSQHVKALETALGIKLFRRSARAIALTAEGRDYLPSIRTAFEVIAKATEATAPGLAQAKAPARHRAGPRQGRLPGAPPSRFPQGVDGDRRLAREGRSGPARRGRARRPAAHLGRGLRRPAYRPHRRPGGDSGRMPAILVTRPGIAGCRQHRTLVKLLRA